MTDQYEVVIVGHGPAGVACANLLGARGIIRGMGLDEVTARMHRGVT